MSGKSIAAYVLGILSCLFSFISIFIFWWLSIVGTIAGAVGIYLSISDDNKPAMIVNIVGAALGVVLIILSLILLF